MGTINFRLIAVTGLLLLLVACGTAAPLDRAASVMADASATAGLTPAATATFVSPTEAPICQSTAEAPEFSDILDRLRVDKRPNVPPLMDSPWERSTGDRQERPESDLDPSGGMRVPDRVERGSSALLRFELSNGFKEPKDLQLLGDPPHDFVIRNAFGEEVWRWSETIDVTSGTSTRRFEPQEAIFLDAEWDLTDQSGVAVPDGRYWAYGIVNMTPEFAFRAGNKQIYVGDRPGLDELLDVRLEAKSEIRCGEPLELTLRVKNVADEPLPLWFGVDFDDYFAATPDGEQVWGWWEGGVRILPLLSTLLMPGEERTYTRFWELQDSEGKPVPPSSYRLTARIEASQVDSVVGNLEQAVTEPITVRVIP